MSEPQSAWQASLPFYTSKLFRDVQLSGIFKDSKTFADASPKLSWQSAINAYLSESAQANFSLAEFILRFFTIPEPISLTSDVRCESVSEYIEVMWSTLTRQPDEDNNSSLIPLAEPYIVPGGRFREIYYWDTYFTALGLKESGHEKLITSMLNNFLTVQQSVGCIPNGNRAYYHTRSQPPVMGLLAQLVLEDNATADLKARCLHGLHQEYQFWMDGAEALTDVQPAFRRVVKMPDGSVLNRYYDDVATPRPESYREDIEAAAIHQQESQALFFRDLRAACESGWDFSSRWFEDPADLNTIQTTQIVPVDVNSLLVMLERQLARLYQESGDDSQAARFSQKAEQRIHALHRYMWCEKDGLFKDYNWQKAHQTSVKSLATVLPLFAEIAGEEQAQTIAGHLESSFLKAGGLVTTLNTTGQQWDSPNGWAPLQWFAVAGLRNYGYHMLAREVMERWLNCVEHYFAAHHVMLEKYNVCNIETAAGGGEYDVQLGFGWTNGVTRMFYSLLTGSR
ncbi:alpha,alpha-trehalase TreF [Alteromonas pelagimontana]|uniref:Alpha,alpha-trehalase TreF n=1 Tax=Alteromonas pelagimontana TaxID=1858656 RepID=A0A6M4ME07_9ALTE|nr:alpha,alpha-trehalase TreF [Alteromonas pelagimontana]QJR81342.1 alpha,alpha-trehalase TreF [Alteromonas pelagimontana]